MDVGFINLLLAVLWASLGAAILVYHQAHPDAPLADIRGTGISAGWLAVLLAIYNLVKWFSLRSRSAPRETSAPRHHIRPRDEDRPRNPDFIFDDPEPKGPEQPPGLR
ncbi:MAG: hypothetical protein NZ700_09880 [Gemmataceae bacterium]|nr:hypothetical protein [Gemmataceae bacterium]MDW8264891.1 hypothetical protein [Gemmataceae bacterium]